MSLSSAHREAKEFLVNEKQFHLGFLPTEQSNPKTKELDKVFRRNVSEGVGLLMRVDQDVLLMARSVLAGKEFAALVDTGTKAVLAGKRIVFSGCGATGRLSILLESMWRRYFRDLQAENQGIYEKLRFLEDRVFSIMTGGDYALIRSVEFFEDYASFGRQQVKELNIGRGDVLVAITEGGETSSVLGTVSESVERQANVFLLFNNPADLLAAYIERSRRAIEDPAVTCLDLYCGPMGLAGSTRLQATTSEQLIAGAAMEQILINCLKSLLPEQEIEALGIAGIDYSEAFADLLESLDSASNRETLASYILLEKSIYEQGGLVTYFGNEYLLDIFTDTTERAPTFMIPPFRKNDDFQSPVSWAFVKNPLFPTAEAWKHTLGRSPRCLDWDQNRYLALGASETIAANPPKLNDREIVRFTIGSEPDPARYGRLPNLAVGILADKDIENGHYGAFQKAFQARASVYQRSTVLYLGSRQEIAREGFVMNCSPRRSPLRIMEHMAVKLVLNTISTGTMVLMGRVTSNWMSWVEVSNKKLKDRGIRLIAEITNRSYEDACYRLHESLEELRQVQNPHGERISPVQYTIQKLMHHEVE
ncbi:MAG: hypothetical protein ABS46_01170 [Cytophagaceae bacterium SCN 52-12]|nr:MAG: hypothetical protein ABS46_01170 [Cytophagaceae bacterium SCN 52-12]